MIEYFSHDYNARNDIKVKKLFMKQGLQGIGLYWCLIEMLYENGGYVLLEQIPVIAFDLRIGENIIIDTIDNYDLFSKNKDSFYSTGVLKRLEIREEKSQKARDSAKARWGKCERNANAEQTESDGNAIKEKESKEKNKKEYKKPTFEEIKEYAISRNRLDLSQKFFDYFEAGGWIDSKGNKVKNWKQKFITWEQHNASQSFKGESNKHGVRVEGIENAFNMFWKAYPKKKDKKASEKVFFKLFKSLKNSDEAKELFNNIFQGLNLAIIEWQEKYGEDTNFIPYPTTWLNKERWNDFNAQED